MAADRGLASRLGSCPLNEPHPVDVVIVLRGAVKTRLKRHRSESRRRFHTIARQTFAGVAVICDALAAGIRFSFGL